jgi:twitching motility protein PilT
MEQAIRAFESGKDATATGDPGGGKRPSLSELHFDDLLKDTVAQGGSDLHLTAGVPPIARIDGRLVKLDYEKLDPRAVQRLIYDVLSGDQIRAFETTKELDFSYGIPGVGRYRVNVYRQRGSTGVALRVIPSEIPTLQELRLPPLLRDLALRHSGLVLVTGPTGSGKSTTLAAMVGVINADRDVHVMTIEDPIEYLHLHKRSIVNQRELHLDTESFHNALRAVLREDPDVILVGEMRDLETIQAALTLAETGHLVFATLHTRNAPQTIDRIVDVFPPHQQDQIKVQLSNSIEAVLAQQLLPMIGGGRICALEIMLGTSGVRNLIREGKTHQIGSLMETSGQIGMLTMDSVLVKLHRNGQVSLEEARKRAIDPENFDRLLSGN